jgi:regulator of replication initiation timing
MAPGEAVEIHGVAFTPTADGTLRVEEVRERLGELVERLRALEAENAQLRERVEHVEALRRLAEATVIQASELARQIEAEARAQAEERLRACEEELAARRREFEARQAAEVEAFQARARQFQAALDAAQRTLAEALQAMGGAALTASAQPTPPAPTVPEASAPQEEPAPARPAAEPSPVALAEQPAQPPPAAAAEPVAETPPAMRPDEEASSPRVADAAAEEVVIDEQVIAERLAAIDAALAEIEPFAPAPASPQAAEADSTERTVALTDAPAAAGPDAAPAPLPASGEPDSARTIEIEMRPVRSFNELTRLTKVLGQIAPGAQPIDLSLPQHRAVFAVRGYTRAALVAQLRQGLPEATVRERDGGIDVLLEPTER